ncbi:MAG: hypothetical protein H7A48_08415 [Akkermansiaceae bacterium]|nr:hypothetical protein [Akkermansiaceae bacterium]
MSDRSPTQDLIEPQQGRFALLAGDFAELSAVADAVPDLGELVELGGDGILVAEPFSKCDQRALFTIVDSRSRRSKYSSFLAMVA